MSTITETASKARAAQAQADVKAAQASGLLRTHAIRLREQWDRADAALDDAASQTPETAKSA